MSEAIRIFISGSCAGLAEVRQALSSHDAIKVVGTAVDAPSAGDRLREESVDVLLHGSSRGDRLPTQDIHTLQSASPAPIVIVTSGCTPEFLQEALAHGVQDVAILPQLTESLVFTLRRAHVLNHNVDSFFIGDLSDFLCDLLLVMINSVISAQGMRLFQLLLVSSGGDHAAVK